MTQAYDAKTFGGTAIPGVESAEFMYDANNIVGIQLEFNSIKEMLDGKTLLEAKGFKCYESMVGVRLYVALGSPSPECPPGCDSHAGIHAFDCDQNDACCPNKQHDSQCSCWGCRNDGFCDCCGMSPGPDPDWCHCPQRGPGGNGGDCAHTLNLDLELQGEFDEDEQDDIRIWDRLWTYVGTPETARLYLENTWNGESPF